MDDLTIEHLAKHCSAHLASCGIDCEIETELSAETIACLTKLDELSPHQFAQVFKAAGETNPDILSCEEAHQDCDNIKKWLAAARKEIEQLEQKGTWTECLSGSTIECHLCGHTQSMSFGSKSVAVFSDSAISAIDCSTFRHCSSKITGHQTLFHTPSNRE